MSENELASKRTIRLVKDLNIWICIQTNIQLV
jgi:hypothetical protein